MRARILYSKYSVGRHWEFHPTWYAEEFLKFLKDQSFKGLIVDIGCGIGRDVNVFHKHGFATLGIDIDQNVVKRAKQRYPQLDFQIQNAENITLASGSVGAVFMINIIHYLNAKKALQEVWRVLQQGGWVYIHFNLTITDFHGHIDYHQSRQDILRLIKEFQIVREQKLLRQDNLPIRHVHSILELILRKPVG